MACRNVRRLAASARVDRWWRLREVPEGGGHDQDEEEEELNAVGLR